MTPQFITLPSGLRVNTAHILEYRSIGENRVLIIQSSFEDINGRYPKIEEDMTAEQLDDLLNPPSSPIVSPVPQVDSITYNGAVAFLFEGKRKHGVVDGFGMTSIGPYMRICSDGVYYTHHFGQKDAFLDERD